VATGYILSERDAERLERLLRQMERYAPPEYLRRRRQAGGGLTKRYARIVRGLRRADPTTDPPTEAHTAYKIKLLSEAAYDDWSATHGEYKTGDKVTYKGIDYQCTKGHISHDSRSPTNETYWTILNPDAYVFGYQYNNDLTQTAPWLQANDIVEVIKHDSLPKPNDWYIVATVGKVEKHDEEKLLTSLQWNDQDKRIMAVYK